MTDHYINIVIALVIGLALGYVAGYLVRMFQDADDLEKTGELHIGGRRLVTAEDRRRHQRVDWG